MGFILTLFCGLQHEAYGFFEKWQWKELGYDNATGRVGK